MKITQKAIAKMAGVSQTTVSLVLNGLADNAVPEMTAKKVLTVAERMGYRRRAVPLKKEGSLIKNVGYLASSYNKKNFLEKQYHSRFLSGLVPLAEKKNFHIVMYENYSYMMQAVFNNLLDGLVIEEEKFTGRGVEPIRTLVPAVCLNWRADGLLDSVMPDNKGGIRKSVMRLYSLGHRNIALFGMKPFSVHTEERLQGYLDALKECGLKLVDSYIRISEATRRGDIDEEDECSLEALKSWMKLKKRPTAVITFADCYALSLIKAAGKLGIRLPEDFSVIGFDNMEYCGYSVPSLSSIEQPMEEMARKALLLLSERMDNPAKPIENVIFDVELIERGSICENKKEIQ